MNRHTFYPRVIPTVPSRRRQLMRFLRWLTLFMVGVLMAVGAATAITKLNTIDAQLDNAFFQGLQAGMQICRPNQKGG